MGCASSETVITPNTITLEAKKFKIYSELKKGKLSAEGHLKQKEIVNEFKKNPSVRSYPTEGILISQVVTIMNKIHGINFLKIVYTVLKETCDKINQYAHHIENEQLTKKTLFPSFSLILYTQSIVNDEQLTKLCSLLKEKFQILKPAKVFLLLLQNEEVQSEILRHMKSNVDPSKKMMNDYVLKLCNQEGLTMADINQNHHQFKYGV